MEDRLRLRVLRRNRQQHADAFARRDAVEDLGEFREVLRGYVLRRRERNEVDEARCAELLRAFGLAPRGLASGELFALRDLRVDQRELRLKRRALGALRARRDVRRRVA